VTHSTMPRTGNQATSPAPPRRGSPSIRPQRIRERDHFRRDWGVVLLEGETLDDALNPSFFGLMSHVILPGHHIEVVSHDYGQWADLLVAASDDILRTVTAVVLHGPVDLRNKIKGATKFDFSKVLVEEVAGTWRVRHGHTVMRSEFQSRKAAEKWLGDKAAGVLGE
jgi:hypothetical protein